MQTVDTTAFGVPSGDSVCHDAPARVRRRIARRALTLLGLALGTWLLGMVLHSATANATPTDTPRPTGLTAQVHHLHHTVEHVVEQASPRVVHQTATHVVAHVAPTVHRVAKPVTGAAKHTIKRSVRTLGHVVRNQIRPIARTIVHPVVRPIHDVLDPVTRPTARPVESPVTAARIASTPVTDRARQDVPMTHIAPHTMQLITASQTAIFSLPGRRAAQIALSATTIVASPVRSQTALTTQPLNPVPSSPTPLRLPLSPGGSTAAGGTGSSGHDHGEMPVRCNAAARARGSLSRLGSNVGPPRSFEKRPGFSPD